MSMRILAKTIAAATATCAIACSGEGQAAPADLPEGWESAEHIENFVQSACGGSPYQGAEETATSTSVDGGIHIDYEPAHFRCEQDVEGFIKVEAASIDVLVQPIDMNPSSIVRCDCLYAVGIDFSVAPGRYRLTLYRRWDHKSGQDEPVKIGSETVDSP